MSRNSDLYLLDILDAGQAIQDYVKGYDYETFAADRRTLDAVVRCFEVIGEAVKHLPEEWKAEHLEIPWHAIAAFRNILAHAYFNVDASIVWTSLQRDLEPLLGACEQLQKSK
ncbi:MULTISPECIES: DUF86 domain-containing protein [unclassified Lentimonas]|uniref:HepT-like ribonuclease domain-containing protein n=1 Tax=unclassified Lentimonas TaxID=2630993 RepID=UPI00132BCD06|nr:MULTISPECIES: DUF86 domain-containing protein [unclassified Lentimonas]CAA6680050.1 Unannotated [Lentimonas sp. CC4]CAA6685170.1 Unannotated [Lentimonas sp. CC6]CAA7075104.1 Unannotated [Lentimonas sp. CC4]CAA7168436.1 Unannotated [Lentimonas sp. CC21]CAA7182129.1 Unannotated [Lentimonas sp. CC8]